MIRFAWLQWRTQTLVTSALVAALAIAAAITGIQLAHVYDSLVANCHSSCDLAIRQFLNDDSFLDHTFDILARAVPALIGIFWGAPLLAREFETGTYRLAWTQGVSRRRWLLDKLGIGALVSAVLSGALTVMITWWYRSRDQVSTSPFQVFDRRDIAPIAYALFAFAVGVLLGALIRRTLPAMAGTLAVFVLARIAVSIWIRPHLMAPKHLVSTLLPSGRTLAAQLAIGSSNGGPVHVFVQAAGPGNSWTLSTGLVTPTGQRVSPAQLNAFLHQHCANALANVPPPPGGGKITHAASADPGRQCLRLVAHTYDVSITYQPATRYWIFQWLEAAIFVALALIAVLATFRTVARRR